MDNNPLSYTDPSGFGFFSSLFRAIGNVFRAIRQNFRTILAIGISFIPGINVVVAGFISGLITGGDIKSGIIGALTAGLTKYIGDQIRAGFYGYLHDQPRFFAVSRNLQGGIERAPISGIPSEGGNIFVNGIDNTLEQAAKNGLRQFGEKSFTLAYNPTHGVIADLTESFADKFIGPSSLSRKLADALQPLAASAKIDLVLHSQGALVGANALNVLADRGVRFANLSVTFNGAAISATQGALSVNSVNGLVNGFNANFFDAVPNVAGSLSPNPLRALASTLASPSLFTKYSPHSSLGFYDNTCAVCLVTGNR